MTVFRKFCAAVLCALMPLSLLACAAPASSSTASPPASTAPTATPTAPVSTAPASTPTAPAAPASTRSPQWEDPSGYVMTGKLDEMSDPTEALYVADPSMSIGTHTPLNWRRGKVPGDDEQVYFFLTADPSYLTSFSISSYAFETPEALTDERTQAWFSWGFDQYIHTQLHVAEQDFVFDVATPVQIGTIEGSEAPMPGYVAPFAIHRDGYTIYGKYYAFLAGPHGYICTLTSLPAFWEEAQTVMDQTFSTLTYLS